jgi:outer membrane protein OmpA-like peptidoglycan-associated protein/flagellar hook assembly protein FlgD
MYYLSRTNKNAMLIILSMMLLSIAPALTAQTAEKAQEFYSPGYLSTGTFVTSYASPQASAFNPAASALTQRNTLDVSYFALSGENQGVSGLEGHALNLGATFPSKIGVFSFSGHYIGSSFPDFYAGNDFTFKSSFAKELYTGISTGAGLGFGFSGDGGVSAVLDIGFIQELGPRSFVKDLRWGAALQNIGYTTIEGAYPPSFGFTGGVRALLVDSDSVGFAVTGDLGFPGFSNVKLGLGGELTIGKFLSITSGTRVDLEQLLEGDSYQLIPSIGLMFTFTTDIDDDSDFLGLSERGWNRSEIKTSFTLAPVVDNVWAIGGGVNIPLGVVDNKPPEIDIDISGITLGENQFIETPVIEETPKDDQEKNVSMHKAKGHPERNGTAVKGSPKAGSGKGFVKSVAPVQESSKTVLKRRDPRYDDQEILAYISPNNDGVQDEVSIPVKITDSRYLVRYALVVEDSGNRRVRIIENKEKRAENEGFRGFFERLFSVKKGIDIPELIRWDGTDNDGALVEDGLYYFYIEAYDDNGNRGVSEKHTIIVDTVPPEIEIESLESDEKIFSPNADGLKDTITFVQSGSYEEFWNGEIRDSEGRVRRSVSWRWSEPEAFTWDGTDDAGVLLEDGVYSYVIQSRDRAGNGNEASVRNIVINTEETPIALIIDRSHFSPGSDGPEGRIEIIPEVPVKSGVESWKLVIADKSGTPYRTYSGEGRAPETLVFNGLDDNGVMLPEGRYLALLEMIYINGNRPSSQSPEFVIDITQPQASVRVSEPVFSPDGDGNKDTVTFYQETSLEERWKGEIFKVGDTRTVVRTYRWVENAQPELVWEGITDNGSLAPDGRYGYILSSTDRAGNQGQSQEVFFDLDTSEASILLSAEYEAFSPNGNGRRDRIGLTTKVDEPAMVERYSILVLDNKDNEVRTIEGTGAPLERYYWDGRDDQRRIVDDGTYLAEFRVVLKNGNRSETRTRPFIVDTVAPDAQISADFTLFSPDGDGRRDALPVEQESSEETLWTGEIINENGNTVRSFFWKGETGNFRWDGKGEAGNVVPDGVYRYKLHALDQAGNVFETVIENITVDTSVTTIFVTAEASALSPTGNGMYEDIGFNTIVNNRRGISSWTLEMIRDGDKVEKSFSGESRIPNKVIWDGRNEAGNYVEGSYKARFTVSYEKGNQPVAESASFLLDRTAPELSADLSPIPFSPDNDGVDDELAIELSVKDASEIAQWSFVIYDPEGRAFKTYQGKGQPTRRIIWDGKSDTGELVYSAMDYPYQFVVSDVLGNQSYQEGRIPVDVLVVREGNLLKIQIASIIFQPNKAEFIEDNQEVADRNRYVLDRLAEILTRYRNYQITVEGHAVNTNWANPERARVEEQNELQPLSQQRAEKVVEALVDRGIALDRLNPVGEGGTKPLVPHGDLDNRWKNRRVEFILENK